MHAVWNYFLTWTLHCAAGVQTLRGTMHASRSASMKEQKRSLSVHLPCNCIARAFGFSGCQVLSSGIRCTGHGHASGGQSGRRPRQRCGDAQQAMKFRTFFSEPFHMDSTESRSEERTRRAVRLATSERSAAATPSRRVTSASRASDSAAAASLAAAACTITVCLLRRLLVFAVRWSGQEFAILERGGGTKQHRERVGCRHESLQPGATVHTAGPKL